LEFRNGGMPSNARFMSLPDGRWKEFGDMCIRFDTIFQRK